MDAQRAETQPYCHYSQAHRLVAWISEHVCGRMTYRQRHGLIKGMLRRGGLGWLPQFMSGPADTAEQTFWSRVDLRELVIYDIGAFQGLLTMFFARQARRVVAYEPNSRSHARLAENLALNGLTNVTLRKVGLSSKHGSAIMTMLPLMPGGASIDTDATANMLDFASRTISEEVSLTSLDDDIREQSLPLPDFIKIDVEGAELDVIQGARQTLLSHKVQLFIELHGETMERKRKNAARVVLLLQDLGYGHIRHIESNTEVIAQNAEQTPEGHLYCRS